MLPTPESGTMFQLFAFHLLARSREALRLAGGRGHLTQLLDTSTYSYFHQVGTCRMGSTNDSDAVVDPTLCVRGVDGLCVADASAMPTIARGNTYHGCVMLAERLAEMMA